MAITNGIENSPELGNDKPKVTPDVVDTTPEDQVKGAAKDKLNKLGVKIDKKAE